MKLTHVEDVITIAVDHLYDPEFQKALGDEWFSSFISNVYGWAVAFAKPLTTEQARITLRILQKTRGWLVKRGIATEQEIQTLVSNPVYRKTPTQSANIPREVRYVGDNLLAFRFKQNDEIKIKLKSLADAFGITKIEWDYTARVWIVPVTGSTLGKITEIIAAHKFAYDEDVERYLTEAAEGQDRKPSFTYDAETKTIRAVVPRNELVSAWIVAALGGRPI